MASFIGELLNVCLNYLDPPVKLSHPEEDGEIHLAVFGRIYVYLNLLVVFSSRLTGPRRTLCKSLRERRMCILFCLVSR